MGDGRPPPDDRHVSVDPLPLAEGRRYVPRMPRLTLPLLAFALLASLASPVSADEPAAQCMGLPVTIHGTAGDDLLEGTPGVDVIRGFGGDDVIHGRDGDDVICGGGGDDEIHGGRGADLIAGGKGSDLIYGGSDDDLIRGGDAGDVIHGGRGGDEILGRAGDDRLHGDQGDDVIRGGSGFDIAEGGVGDDKCASAEWSILCELPVPPHPGDAVNCTSFAVWQDAQIWFDRHWPHYGDVAHLDNDGDLVACETLPGSP